jgi:acyl-[acyl-carrier-protein]-phospholipid O-acyltransferase / long-chain-fatty-acid--[acyl-carrier-protein] ligase
MKFDPKSGQTTLFEALLETRRRFGGARIVLEDADKQKLSYDQLTLGSLVLGRALVAGTRRGETIGLFLPNSAALAVSIFGLNAYGRVVALLNFTFGERNIVSAAKTARLKTVVTSRRFVEAAKLEAAIEALKQTETAPGRTVKIVYLEDIKAALGPADKAIGYFRFLIAHSYHRRQGARPDSPAFVLFTSGTEGRPKGVVLTNRNIVTNAQQMFVHADGALTAEDIVFNPLPMFHSFGLTAATIMPILSGIRVILYPTPMHYRQIPKAIRRSKATVLFATDTFLMGYARAAEDGDLTSLRLVIAGAERIKEETRKRWARIGTDILEGYGATECAPVISCNVPGSNRKGTVGRLLPGMELQLEKVEGLESGGMLKVRGQNVMAGYLRPDQPGVLEPPKDGWHETGDIVDVDQDGYIIVKGRAKRFAKIGGEMVSLAAVESLAAETWPRGQHVVVNVSDPRKGERLVLVTDSADAARDGLLRRAREKGFPELWVPKHILIVAAIPLMTSGKVDLRATAALAEHVEQLQ